MADVVAEPAGSKWFDPFSGADMTGSGAQAMSGAVAMIAPPSGPAFREFVPIYHEGR